MYKDMQISGIMGTNYCGSTLLNFIVGSHSKVFTPGELNAISGSEGKNTKCRICISDDCPFWSKEFVLKCYDNMSNRHKLVNDKAKKMYNPDIIFYSEKHPKVYKEDMGLNMIDKLIILFKKPESYCHSEITHVKKSDIKIAMEKYCFVYQNTFNISEKIPHMFLSYENLCKKTEESIKRICNFLNIDFEKDMLYFWEKEFHTISGNRGVYLSFAPEKRRKLYETKDKYWQTGYSKEHHKYYDSAVQKIIYDEKWKKGLSDKEKGEIISTNRAQKIYQELKQKETNV